MANWLLADCISERARAGKSNRDEVPVTTIALMRRLPTLSQAVGPPRSLLDYSPFS